VPRTLHPPPTHPPTHPTTSVLTCIDVDFETQLFFRYAAPALRADADVVLAAAAQNGLALAHASVGLRDDPEVG